jgi:type II secretory pathway component PulK
MKRPRRDRGSLYLWTVIMILVLAILAHAMTVSWAAGRRRAVERHHRERSEAAAFGGVRLGAALLRQTPDRRGDVTQEPIALTLTDREIVSRCGAATVRADWRLEGGRVVLSRWRRH